MISILTLAYYLKLQRLAFFGELNKKWEKIKEVPGPMKLSMLALSLICLVGGIILMTAFGQEEKIQTGKSIILYSVLGLVFTIMSYIIVSFIQAIIYDVDIFYKI